MKATITTALVLTLWSAPASAFQCPQDMAKIDAALRTAQLSDADKASVTEFRKQGEDLHRAGKHQESMDALAKAMVILKLK